VSIDAIRFAIPGADPVVADVTIEAELPDDTSLLAPMVIVPDETALSGGYLVAPDGTGIDTSTGDSRAGQAQYNVTIPTSGDVTFWARVDFASFGANSLHYKLDGVSGWQTFNKTTTTGFEWREITTFTGVAAGAYNFRVAYREDGSKIDQLFFTVNGATPDAAPASPPVADAKYVAPAPMGNDSNDGSASAPWATLKKAAETAVAGDTVYFREGIYTISEEAHVKNDGNRNAWITFEAYPGEQPIFDANDWTINPDGSWMNQDDGLMSLDDREYVRVKGLHFRNSHGTGIGGANAFRCEVIDCTVENTFATAIGFGSHFGVPGTKSRHVKIIGCTVIRANIFQMAADPDRRFFPAPNEAINLTGTVDSEVAYNTLMDGGKEGIDAKGDNSRGLIHHNTVVRSHSGSIYIDGGSNEDMYDIEIYENLLFDSRGMNIASERGAAVFDIRVHHNRLIDCELNGIGIGSAAHQDGPKDYIQAYNNTVVRGYASAFGFGTAENSVIRNNLSFYGGNATSSDAALGNVSEYNWAEASYDNGFVDPLFADLENFDLRLLAGSPAIDTGSPEADWIDPDGTRNDPGAMPYHSGDYVDTEIEWAIAYEGESVEIDVLDNDDWSGSITLTASDGDFGTTSIVNNKVVYTPNPGYYGQHDYDVITYTVDNGTVQATQPVRVHVLPVETETGGIENLSGVTIGAGLGSNRKTSDGEWEIQSQDGGLGGGTAGGDELFLAFRRAAGNLQVLGEVTSLGGPSTARAGVMLRESTADDSAFISLSVDDNGGYHWQYRATTGGAISAELSSDPGHATGAQQVRISRSGYTFTLAGSEDGAAFVTLDSVTLSGFSDALDAGLFASSGNSDSNAVASFEPGTVISGNSGFEQIFSEDFSSDPGWNVSSNGTWTVSGGIASSSDFKKNSLYYYSDAETADWDDAIYATRFLAGHNNAQGMMLRIQDEENFYHVLFHVEQKTAQFVKVEDDIHSALRVVPFSINEDQWYDLEVEAVGNTFLVLVDGQDVFGGGVVDNRSPYFESSSLSPLWPP